LIVSDHWLYLFFNNLEEVVKNLSVCTGALVMSVLEDTGGL
jgi:hypothetical protein